MKVNEISYRYRTLSVVYITVIVCLVMIIFLLIFQPYFNTCSQPECIWLGNVSLPFNMFVLEALLLPNCLKFIKR